MRTKRSRRLLAGVMAAVAGTAGLLAVAAPAQASTQYYSLVAYGSCGSIAPLRELTEATGGYMNASSGLFSWTFTVTSSTSRVHWQACGSAAPYGNYDVPANRLAQTFQFTVTSPNVLSCNAGGGSCSVGIGTAKITAFQAAYNTGALTYYLSGDKISALYPARLTVRAIGSVIYGAYGGTVSTAQKVWAV